MLNVRRASRPAKKKEKQEMLTIIHTSDIRAAAAEAYYEAIDGAAVPDPVDALAAAIVAVADGILGDGVSPAEAGDILRDACRDACREVSS